MTSELTRQSTEGALPQATLLTRQALFLRPDTTRVLVCPFKPTAEPRKGMSRSMLKLEGRRCSP
jgi:hypothetical protein